MRYSQTVGAALLALLLATPISLADQGHSNSGSGSNSNATAAAGSSLIGSSPNADTADVLKVGSPSFKRACLDAKNNPDRHQAIMAQCRTHGY